MVGIRGPWDLSTSSAESKLWRPRGQLGIYPTGFGTALLKTTVIDNGNREIIQNRLGILLRSRMEERTLSSLYKARLDHASYIKISVYK